MGQSQPPVSAATQPLNQTLSAESDTNGNASFTFQNPPTGLIWTGSLCCQNAPGTAVFTVVIGATTWGTFNGSSIGGPVQCNSSQQVKVTATGLTPNTDWVMQWTGSSDAETGIQPIWPDPSPSVAQLFAPSGTVLFGAAAVTTPGFLTVPTAPATRTLVLAFRNLGGSGSITDIIVTGDDSGVTYYNQPPYMVIGSPPAIAFAVVPIVGPLDNLFAISWSGSGSWVLEIFGDTALYDESTFYNGAVQEGQLLATGALFTGPARLLTLQAQTGTGGNINVEIGGTIILVTSNGQQSILTFPQPYIIPFGVAVSAALTGSASVQASWAFP